MRSYPRRLPMKDGSWVFCMKPMDVAVLNRKIGPLAEEPENLAGELRGRELRRSLSMVTLAWVFGSVWATATAGAPLTIFASSLRASSFQFGLLAALPFIASLISMPASLLTERT